MIERYSHPDLKFLSHKILKLCQEVRNLTLDVGREETAGSCGGSSTLPQNYQETGSRICGNPQPDLGALCLALGIFHNWIKSTICMEEPKQQASLWAPKSHDVCGDHFTYWAISPLLTSESKKLNKWKAELHLLWIFDLEWLLSANDSRWFI